jgi:hypothetical protein
MSKHWLWFPPMEKIHFGLLCLVIGDSDGSLTGYAGDYGVKVAFGTRKPNNAAKFVLE